MPQPVFALLGQNYERINLLEIFHFAIFRVIGIFKYLLIKQFKHYFLIWPAFNFFAQFLHVFTFCGIGK